MLSSWLHSGASGLSLAVAHFRGIRAVLTSQWLDGKSSSTEENLPVPLVSSERKCHLRSGVPLSAMNVHVRCSQVIQDFPFNSSSKN
jgi:hypothetical protein